MLAFDRAKQTELESHQPHRIRVIGVGGAGVNMLDRLKLNHIEGMDLTVANTDQRALQGSVVEDRLQLGRELTMGLGAGGDPEVGRQATEASLADLKERVDRRDLVFLCGGLGGGTGSGSLASMAKLARASGAFVVAFVTMPFTFEGRRRVQQAEAGLVELQRHCHALLTFQNNRMSELIKADDGIHAAFASVDQLISSAISSIAGMVSQPGLIRLGLDDLIAALADNRSDTLFGWGEARGEKRAAAVVKELLKSPLLDKNKLLAQARTVLVHICGGSDLSLFEVEQVMQELSKQLHPDAHLLFGTAVDPKKDGLSLTVISSLSEDNLLPVTPDQDEVATKPTATPLTVRRAPAASAADFGRDAAAPTGAAVEAGPGAEETFETDYADSAAGEEFVEDYLPADEAAADLDETPLDDAELGRVDDDAPDAAELAGDAELEEPLEEFAAEEQARVEDSGEPDPAEAAVDSGPAAEPSERIATAAPAALGGRGPAGSPADAPARTLTARERSMQPAAEARSQPVPVKVAPPQGALKAQPLRTGSALDPEDQRFAGRGRDTAPLSPPAAATGEAEREVPPSGTEAAAERGAAERTDGRPRRQNETDLFEAGSGPRGRFTDSDPTIENGEDLDLPTFLRRKK